jgi:hypothetical protein
MPSAKEIVPSAASRTHSPVANRRCSAAGSTALDELEPIVSGSISTVPAMLAGGDPPLERDSRPL